MYPLTGVRRISLQNETDRASRPVNRMHSRGKHAALAPTVSRSLGCFRIRFFPVIVNLIIHYPAWFVNGYFTEIFGFCRRFFGIGVQEKTHAEKDIRDKTEKQKNPARIFAKSL